MDSVQPIEPSAYTYALAMESWDPKDGKFDPDLGVFNGVSFEDLERFSRIVAYKVAHNLGNGYRMDPLTDPLLYVDCKDYPVLGDKDV